MYIVQTLGALHAGIKGLRYGARSEEKEREEERESKKVRGVGSGRVHAAARPGNECLTRDSEIFSFFFFFFFFARPDAEPSRATPARVAFVSQVLRQNPSCCTAQRSSVPMYTYARGERRKKRRFYL